MTDFKAVVSAGDIAGFGRVCIRTSCRRVYKRHVQTMITTRTAVTYLIGDGVGAELCTVPIKKHPYVVQTVIHVLPVTIKL